MKGWHLAVCRPLSSARMERGSAGGASSSRQLPSARQTCACKQSRAPVELYLAAQAGRHARMPPPQPCCTPQ